MTCGPDGKSGARARARAFVVLGAVSFVMIACTSGNTAPAGSASVGAAAVPFRPDEPIDIRSPGLELLAAFELRGREPEFGGISAALVDGPDLLLLSDRGTLFRSRRVLADDGRLTGLHEWSRVRLRKEPSRQAPDTEGLTRAADGSLILSIENDDQLARLGPAGLEPGRTLPPWLAGLPGNEGVESLATLPGGALLAIGEAGSATGDHPIAVIDEAGAEAGTMVAENGFRPTGADVVDGYLVLIERRVSLLGGLAGRLTAVRVGAAQRPILHPTVLAMLDGEHWGENWEAVALERQNDHAIIYVVSDDNFSALQRTLLVQLRWTPPTA